MAVSIILMSVSFVMHGICQSLTSGTTGQHILQKMIRWHWQGLQVCMLIKVHKLLNVVVDLLSALVCVLQTSL